MSAPTFDLGTLHGGLRLPANKSASTDRCIVRLPIPRQLILPTTQHVGDPAQPIVDVGERVLKGQLIAEAAGTLGAPVHASSSGTVIAFEAWPVSHRNGESAPCIVIACDGRDEAIEPKDAALDFAKMTVNDLLDKIGRGGIVGLGGAAFPTGQKLAQARTCDLDQLLLNGVECEPYISCDDLLMRERPVEIVRGAQILMQALQIDVCIIAVEGDKPLAIRALLEALSSMADERISLKQVPSIYPSGGEDQLVQLVSNREVPSGGLPTDIGSLVHNVGTAAAVYDWIVNNEPLISRVTTIAGTGVANPLNVRARIGITVGEIIEQTGGYTEHAQQMVIGGPMTGKSVNTDRVPLVKATNCVLVSAAMPTISSTLACIRCGDCAAVCPVQLLPQQLFWYACTDNDEKLGDFGLKDCIECGCCDLVCPSHIPLTADFRVAKRKLQQLDDENARAARARRRFEARTDRLQAQQRKREAELALQRASAQRAGPSAIADILNRKKHDREPNP